MAQQVTENEMAAKSSDTASRLVKTLVYWPLEEEHVDDDARLAWILVLSCLALGIIASFENIFFGVGLAILCLYGSAAVRYVITRAP